MKFLRGAGRLSFDPVVYVDKNDEYVFSPARYAKGKILFTLRQMKRKGHSFMTKTRGQRLADSKDVGGKWTNRGRGYVVSPAAAERLYRYLEEGRDASFFSRELDSPEGSSESVVGRHERGENPHTARTSPVGAGLLIGAKLLLSRQAYHGDRYGRSAEREMVRTVSRIDPIGETEGGRLRNYRIEFKESFVRTHDRKLPIPFKLTVVRDRGMYVYQGKKKYIVLEASAAMHERGGNPHTKDAMKKSGRHPGRVVRDADTLQEKLGVELLRGQFVAVGGETYRVGNFLDRGKKVVLWREQRGGNTRAGLRQRSAAVPPSAADLSLRTRLRRMLGGRP